MERLLKMKIKTKDKIVQAVLRKMDKRSIVGQKKYGQTMENEIDTGKKDLYIEAAKRCLTEEIEEAALKQFVLHDEEEEL